MSARTKDVFTAEEVLEQIFAEQDSDDPGDSSDSLDPEEEAEEKESADEAETIRTGTSKFRGYY